MKINLILSFLMSSICFSAICYGQCDDIKYTSLMVRTHYSASKSDENIMAMNTSNIIGNLSNYRYLHTESGSDGKKKNKNDYDTEMEVRGHGIVGVVFGSLLLVGGPVLLGYGVSGRSADRARGANVTLGHSVEIGVGSALSALGILALVEGAVTIRRANKIMNGTETKESKPVKGKKERDPLVD